MSEKIHLTAEVPTRAPDPEHSSAARFCPRCGREISVDQQLCAFCENTGAIPRPKRSRKQMLLTLLAVMVLLGVLLAVLIRVVQAPVAVLRPDATPFPHGTSVPVILQP